MDAHFGEDLETFLLHVGVVLGEFRRQELDGFDAHLRGGRARFGDVVVEVAGGGGRGGIGGAV